MSTSHPDTAQRQDTLPPSPSSAPRPDASGPGGGGYFPPPVKTPPSGQRWIGGIAIVALIALILGVFILAVLQFGRQPAGTSTSSPTATAAPSTTPAVVLGPQSCPAGVADSTRWQPIINTYESGAVATAGRVECASLTGVSSLQALVLAQRADQTMDAFAFNNITAASPSLIFQMKGLLKGDARISAYSTIMTAEVDQRSSINAGKPLTAMTVDLFREFAWSTSSGVMQQVAFPGIFPDLTRYQAEVDQVGVNGGHQPWKLSATDVARTMAITMLDWPTTSMSATLTSGGGPQDTHATVAVNGKLLGPTTTLTVTLARLGDKTSSDIWEVVSVTTAPLAFTSPAPLSLLVSPVTVTGTGNAFEGDVGHVSLLDHLYTSIGEAKTVGAVGMGTTTFTSTLTFTPTFTAGVQEGVLLNVNEGGISGPVVPAAMEKVLISGGH